MYNITDEWIEHVARWSWKQHKGIRKEFKALRMNNILVMDKCPINFSCQSNHLFLHVSGKELNNWGSYLPAGLAHTKVLKVEPPVTHFCSQDRKRSRPTSIGHFQRRNPRINFLNEAWETDAFARFLHLEPPNSVPPNLN